MASYPSAIKNFNTVVNGVTKLVASLFNLPYAEITAIETELGTDPAGSAADLKTRLAVSLNADGTIKNEAVFTTALKTATGEVSHTGDSTQTSKTLPGGEYGFFPQVKVSTNSNYGAAIITAGQAFSSTSYLTTIMLYTGSGANTIYCQQRYVTASGQDHWIFLLLDKNTKELISAYQAPDHPAYGNGGDFDKVPHPFIDYDENIQEIVLIDKETCNQLKAESEQTGKSILTLVNEDYKPSIIDQVYQPLHSGKFIDKQPVMLESIPDYIKVRGLSKLTEQEKTNRESLRQQKINENNEARITKENKIKQKLGINDQELAELKEIIR